MFHGMFDSNSRFSFVLALVCHNTATNSWQYAMAFAFVCILHKSQFESTFHGNPAFTFATWLSKGKMSCFDVLKQVMFQIFGYAFGFWFGGVIECSEIEKIQMLKKYPKILMNSPENLFLRLAFYPFLNILSSV